MDHLKDWAREVLSTTSVTFTFGNIKIEKKPLYSFASYSAPAILTTSSSPASTSNDDDDNDTRDTDDETPKASEENIQPFLTAEETSSLTPPGPPRPKPSSIPRLNLNHLPGRRQRSCSPGQRPCSPGQLEKGYKGKDEKKHWMSKGSGYGAFD